AEFLGGHPDFALADAAAVWRAALGDDLPEAFRAPVAGLGDAIRLTPASAGTDGFFVAVMRRAA
ncbi:MAG TPA: MFS transporter, partial [Hyphomicrobiales bacterium]|nr:MFS transporter [Hyphomicrobiales bacterium]